MSPQRRDAGTGRKERGEISGQPPDCPLPSLRLDMLHAFVVLCEELHFGRAAARLFLSPSGLSRRIGQLEQAVDARLFARNPRTVALTADGTALLPVAQVLLNRARDLELLVRSAADA